MLAHRILKVLAMEVPSGKVQVAVGRYARGSNAREWQARCELEKARFGGPVIPEGPLR